VRAVQVSWHTDPQRRTPTALLAAWPTLVDAAAAGWRAGVDIVVVQAAHEDATIERAGVRFEFVRVAGLAAGTRWHWAHPPDRRVLLRIAALQPDVLHQHGLTHPLHARALVRQFPGVPLVVQDHASRPPRRLRRVHRWAMKGVTAVAFTSREQAAPFLAAGALSPDVRVLELLEGSTRFTAGDPADARATTGIGGAPCLLWLGHLDTNKDPLTVLRAFARAADQLPDARLWMVFLNAPLRAEVEASIEELRLAERVTLLGAVPHDRVEQLLRAADFLVQASRFEGSGYAVIEALACGAMPLVTDIPSFRRITRDGGVGELFAVGDVDALTQALVRAAAQDPAELRVRARAHFERYLSLDILGAELRSAYECLASA
jgi:glycosyltransferase involved in cell wall biosynthesis